jgi:hypothetical protein
MFIETYVQLLLNTDTGRVATQVIAHDNGKISRLQGSEADNE